MLNEKKPTEVIAEKPAEPIDFSHLGAKQISGPIVAETDAKPVDLSNLYGERGGIVGHIEQSQKPTIAATTTVEKPIARTLPNLSALSNPSPSKARVAPEQPKDDTIG
jgi:hypothetical protein